MHKTRFVCAAIGSCLILFLAPCFLCAETYDHKIQVETMSFEWKVGEKDLNIRLSAKTKGWIGIGFNPSKKMLDANYILAYVKDDNVEVSDHFGTSKKAHDMDTKHGGQSNVKIISGEEEKGITAISFSIPLNSGDPKDRPLSINQDTIVLLAYGAGRDSFKSKHKFKARFKVNLGTGKYE